MNTLLILNDPPYGTEKSYNALRLARSLLDQKSSDVRVFLMGDAAACALAFISRTSGGRVLANRLAASVTKWSFQRPASRGRNT